MAFYKKTSGILIPAIGFDGRLQGFQIMLDVPLKHKDDPPEKPGAKYIWFSSSSKTDGTGSGSPGTSDRDPSARVVYVIEGAAESRYFPLSDRAHLCRDWPGPTTPARWTRCLPFGAERHGGNH